MPSVLNNNLFLSYMKNTILVICLLFFYNDIFSQRVYKKPAAIVKLFLTISSDVKSLLFSFKAIAAAWAYILPDPIVAILLSGSRTSPVPDTIKI